MKLTRWLSILFIFYSLLVFGQQASSTKISLDENYTMNPVLVNGKFFENIYYRDQGHPFLHSDAFTEGYIILQNEKFIHQKLMYNIFDQTLVLKIEDGSSIMAFIPPVAYISEFSIYNRTFKQLAFQSDKSTFYEVVYEGQLKCYYHYNKSRSQSDHLGNVMAHKFSSEKRHAYVLMHGELEAYRSKGSFLRLFDSQYRLEIKRYMKKNSVNVKTASNAQMEDLLMYCEHVLGKNIAQVAVNKNEVW